MAGFWAESPVTRAMAPAPAPAPAPLAALRPRGLGGGAERCQYYGATCRPRRSSPPLRARPLPRGWRVPRQPPGLLLPRHPPGSLAMPKKAALPAAQSWPEAGKQLHIPGVSQSQPASLLRRLSQLCATAVFPSRGVFLICPLLVLKRARRALLQTVLLGFTTCESVSGLMLLTCFLPAHSVWRTCKPAGEARPTAGQLCQERHQAWSRGLKSHT